MSSPFFAPAVLYRRVRSHADHALPLRVRPNGLRIDADNLNAKQDSLRPHQVIAAITAGQIMISRAKLYQIPQCSNPTGALVHHENGICYYSALGHFFIESNLRVQADHIDEQYLVPPGYVWSSERCLYWAILLEQWWSQYAYILHHPELYSKSQENAFRAAMETASRGMQSPIFLAKLLNS